MCMKSGTYFLIIATIFDFSELRLLNTDSKSDSTPSKDILIFGVFMNPKESYFFIL